MKILVYGAGPLGSLFAARLCEAGQDVSILARGSRLAELREKGIVLENGTSGQREVFQVPVVEQLAPDDAYDLILVIMRKNRVRDILPVLAANRGSPNVLFLMNNAAGPGDLVEALGRERVMIGFPVSGGYRSGDAIRYLGGTEERVFPIPIGEVDGRIEPRTHQVAEVLRSMRGYSVEIRRDMDAWLKTHVAILMPGLAAALYAAGTDHVRLADTRDLLILTARATKEALRVLEALGIKITPPRLKMFLWLPEPILVLFLSKLLRREEMRIALSGHANAARDEISHLVEDFREMARISDVPTPACDQLYPFLIPQQPTVPAGSAILALDWRSTIAAGGLIAALLAGTFFFLRKR